MEKQKRARRRLAQKLRMLRLIKDWSQEDLAGASGLHRTYISSIERGERNVGLDNLEKLADAFGLTVDELLAGQSRKAGRCLRPYRRRAPGCARCRPLR